MPLKSAHNRRFPPEAPINAPKRRRTKHEQTLQASIVAFHALAVIDPCQAILFAVPNGESRDAVTAGILAGRKPRSDSAHQVTDADLLRPRGQGVLEGATDLILLTAGPRTDLIEVKVEASELTGVKRTYLKPAQKRFREAAVGLGHHHHVIRSPEEYEAILRALRVRLRVVTRFPSGAMLVAPG